METICSSETSVDIQRTAWRYIPEDNILHDCFCENPKCYILFYYYLYLNVEGNFVNIGPTKTVFLKLWVASHWRYLVIG
jgi:hypothetical protein